MRIAADSMSLNTGDIVIKAMTDDFYVCSADFVKKSFFGLMSSMSYPVRIISNDGIIRLQKGNARIVETTVESCKEIMSRNISELIEYEDGGEKIPECFVLLDARIIDFSKLTSKEQVMALLNIEMEGVDKQKKAVLVICGKRA